jgi:hypothetical protein
VGRRWRSLPRCYLCVTIILLRVSNPFPQHTKPHQSIRWWGFALSTVTIEAFTLEGDSGRGPDSVHTTVAICTDWLNDLSVDRLLKFSGATALAVKRIDHSFTASFISK